MRKTEVSIDESLIGFEGQGPAIQYMLNKHHYHFGFNLFGYVRWCSLHSKFLNL